MSSSSVGGDPVPVPEMSALFPIVGLIVAVPALDSAPPSSRAIKHLFAVLFGSLVCLFRLVCDGRLLRETAVTLHHPCRSADLNCRGDQYYSSEYLTTVYSPPSLPTPVPRQQVASSFHAKRRLQCLFLLAGGGEDYAIVGERSLVVNSLGAELVHCVQT